MATVWNEAPPALLEKSHNRQGQQNPNRLRNLRPIEILPTTPPVPFSGKLSILAPSFISTNRTSSISKTLIPVENTVAKQPGKRKKPHTKSRGGCITCKTHRVKCDQTRPACLRCERLLRPCGYNDKTHTVAQRNLHPKELPAVRKLIEPRQQLFDNNEEYQYFELFSESIAAKLSPYFSTSKWKEMILQTCAAEQTIREVCVAISALDLTRAVESRNSDPTSKQWIASRRLLHPGHGNCNENPLSTSNSQEATNSTPHHLFALRQYDRAIRRMRENLSTGQQSIRTTLVACIMMSSFEVMHGSHDAASGQLQSGIILYQDWKNRQPDASRHTTGFSSPAPNVVDDFLSQTFGRMELQTMSFNDRRPSECHRKLLSEGTVTMLQMPTVFDSIEHARIYLDLVMRRLLHFVGSLAPPSAPPSVSNNLDASDEPFYTSRLFNSKSNMFGAFEGNGSIVDVDPAPGFGSALHQQEVSTIGIAAEGAQLTVDMDRWSTAFDPILTRQFLPSAEPREMVGALTLKIAALASQICTSTTLNGEETRYDLAMHQFHEIIDYATVLLDTQNILWCGKGKNLHPGPLISFEIGVNPPLSIVGIKCRDPRLRREAVKLLLKYPRTEGVWDSIVTADLSRWAISMEEGWEGEEDPWTEHSERVFIPECKRVKSVGLQYNKLEPGKISMECLQIDLATGEWVTRTKDYVREGWRL